MEVELWKHEIDLIIAMSKECTHKTSEESEELITKLRYIKTMIEEFEE